MASVKQPLGILPVYPADQCNCLFTVWHQAVKYNILIDDVDMVQRMSLICSPSHLSSELQHGCVVSGVCIRFINAELPAQNDLLPFETFLMCRDSSGSGVLDGVLSRTPQAPDINDAIVATIHLPGTEVSVCSVQSGFTQQRSGQSSCA